jgi:hypothetical protein
MGDAFFDVERVRRLRMVRTLTLQNQWSKPEVVRLESFLETPTQCQRKTMPASGFTDQRHITAGERQFILIDRT